MRNDSGFYEYFWCHRRPKLLEDFESFLKVFICAILNTGKDCSDRFFVICIEATDKDFGRKRCHLASLYVSLYKISNAVKKYIAINSSHIVLELKHLMQLKTNFLKSMLELLKKKKMKILKYINKSALL